VHSEDMTVLWASDSHGGNKDKKKFAIRDFLNSISDEKWIEYVSQEDFHIAKKIDNIAEKDFTSNLFRDIASQGPFRDTGATLSIVKITKSQIECYRVGDSPIYVFQDGELIHYSNHQEEYDEDIKKLKKRRNFSSFSSKDSGVTDQTDIEPLSPTTIKKKNSHYIKWDSGCKLNMTRCIGHNDPYLYPRRAKNFPEIEPSIPSWTMTKTVVQRPNREKKGEKVIITTDGFTTVCGTFDYKMMYEMDSIDLMKETYKRWNQEWKFVKDEQISNGTIPTYNRDDIAIVSWNNSQNSHNTQHKLINTP